jgi:hypothetical protein
VFVSRTECRLLCCLVLVAGAAADSVDKGQGTAKAGIHLLRVQNVTTALHGPSIDASEGSVGEVCCCSVLASHALAWGAC